MLIVVHYSSSRKGLELLYMDHSINQINHHLGLNLITLIKIIANKWRLCINNQVRYINRVISVIKESFRWRVVVISYNNNNK